MPAQIPADPISRPVADLAPAEPSRDARLRKHADYQRVYREGKRQSLPLMTYFYAARVSGEGSRVGLTAGRVLGNAVERNRIKRRMRAAIQQHPMELTASVDVILHPRRAVLEAEFAQIEREVLRAFRAVEQALAKACETASQNRH